MGSFIGPVPVNQLNALPLFSSSEVAFGGQVTVVGGAINRYFSPAIMGINGSLMNVTDPDPSGVIAATPYIVASALLDVRGCSRFTLQVGCKITLKAMEQKGGVDYSYNPINVRVMSVGPSDIGAIAPRTGPFGASAWPLVGVFALRYTNEAAPPTRYKSGAVGWMVGGTTTTTPQTGSLGFIYVWLSFNNEADNKTAALWASLYATS